MMMMSLSRLSNILLLNPAKFVARNLSTSSRLQRNLTRWPFSHHHRDEESNFFGLASNLMRNLEREFDYVRRQMEQGFTGLNLSQALPSGRTRLTPKSVSGASEEKSIANQEALNDFVVTDETGNRKFQMSFDLRGFEPEEIKVKTRGGCLTVCAKKEHKSPDEYYLREFSQSFSLPKDLKAQDLKTKWSEEGCLMIEAEMPKLAINEKKKIKEIQIEHGESEDSSTTKQIKESQKKEKENEKAANANLTS